MKRVTRNAKPRSLVRNASRWKRELLEAIREGDKTATSRRRRKYNQADVRETLDVMYGGLCCYCESEVASVRADNVEHRKPWKHFPAETFEWLNLHLACVGCNKAKSDKWDEKNEILDAARDPIERHLTYEITGTGANVRSLSKEGRTTLTHTSLNRNKLRDVRNEVMGQVLGIIANINKRLRNDDDDPVAMDRIDDLHELCNSRFGSMIDWLMQNYLKAGP